MAAIDHLPQARKGSPQAPSGAAGRAALVARGRRYQRWSLIITYALLCVASVVILLPFVWLITSSLKTTAQYFADPIAWIPNPAVWENYVSVFRDYNFLHYIVNSVALAVLSVLADTLSSALVAYGFARFRFKGRNVLFIIVLATMMIPSQVLTISLYTVFRSLGWIDTFLPILVPKLFGSAFLIFVLRQFFLTLPHELDEAARIDGASSLGVFWRIILPQAQPALVVVALFSFLASWRDTWGPLIYLSDDSVRTLPIGLLYFTTPYGPNFPLLLAATTIALAVPVVLYAIGQRYIDTGVAITDLK